MLAALTIRLNVSRLEGRQRSLLRDYTTSAVDICNEDTKSSLAKTRAYKLRFTKAPKARADLVDVHHWRPIEALIDAFPKLQAIGLVGAVSLEFHDVRR